MINNYFTNYNWVTRSILEIQSLTFTHGPHKFEQYEKNQVSYFPVRTE